MYKQTYLRIIAKEYTIGLMSACLNNVDKVFRRAIALTFDKLERRLEQAIRHFVSVNKSKLSS